MKGDKGSFINNAANSIVLIISITINLVLIHIINPFSTQFVAFPFDLLMLCFILLYLPLYTLLVLKEKRKVRREKESLKEIRHRTKDLPLKYDIYRKLTHLVVLGIIFFYFTLGFLIQNFFVYIIEILPDYFITMFDLGDDLMVFTQYLVIFLVGASLIGLLTAEFTRVLIPKYYPLKVVNQILKKKSYI